MSPILSVLLVHDFLFAKKGISLPATHGLRSAVERHKGRIKSELTKSRIRRKIASLEELKSYIEAEFETWGDSSELPYPRWVRINTLKSSLDHQLNTTFSNYQHVSQLKDVRQKGCKRLFIDPHIPNLVAISPCNEISRCDAYKCGTIIFQDKASCFPAYLLDPYPRDGDIIDTCSAPGNKTTHLTAILQSRNSEQKTNAIKILAFEKSKVRSDTLKKMINMTGSDFMVEEYSGQDFLETNPRSPTFSNVGALLLDPSCSGSGIIGRDSIPELHLPSKQIPPDRGRAKQKKDLIFTSAKNIVKKKRKRDVTEDSAVLLDDDREIKELISSSELKNRLSVLSNFQLKLLLHAFQFPSAKKITYSTCSKYAEENELVILEALNSPNVRKAGWRILKREEQISGMRQWPIRGCQYVCGDNKDLAEACIRTNVGDEHGTMGFFVVGFVRDELPQSKD